MSKISWHNHLSFKHLVIEEMLRLGGLLREATGGRCDPGGRRQATDNTYIARVCSPYNCRRKSVAMRIRIPAITRS